MLEQHLPVEQPPLHLQMEAQDQAAVSTHGRSTKGHLVLCLVGLMLMGVAAWGVLPYNSQADSTSRPSNHVPALAYSPAGLVFAPALRSGRLGSGVNTDVKNLLVWEVPKTEKRAESQPLVLLSPRRDIRMRSRPVVAREEKPSNNPFAGVMKAFKESDVYKQADAMAYVQAVELNKQLEDKGVLSKAKRLDEDGNELPQSAAPPVEDLAREEAAETAAAAQIKGDTDAGSSAQSSLDQKMSSWEATDDERRKATLGGVIPTAVGKPGRETRKDQPTKMDGFDMGMAASGVILAPLALAVLAFPFFIGGVDVNSVGPPPTQ